MLELSNIVDSPVEDMTMTASTQTPQAKPNDVRSGRQYRVSADRSSASRKVRYVEGSKPDAENCRICQISS